MTTTARLPVAVEDVPWTDFLRAFDWRQGEHVTMIGPTGTGKTTCAVQLLDRRGYVAALGTKPRDATLDVLERRYGFERVDRLPNAGRTPRVIVWPSHRSLRATEKKRVAETFRRTLDDAFIAGGWCVFADELSYLTRDLRLGNELADVWQRGRSIGVSLIGCTQRPRHVPLDAYSAASHLFLWRSNDDYDLRRLAGLGAADSRIVRRVVESLPRFDVLYVDTRSGGLAITRPPRLDGRG